MNEKAIRKAGEEDRAELNWYLTGGIAVGNKSEQLPIAGSLTPEPAAAAAVTDSNRRGGDLSFAIPTFSGPAASVLSYSTGSKA